MAARKFTVLVADDIPLMRLMLSKFVRKSADEIFGDADPVDLEILEAADGGEARQFLIDHPVDLLFLDLMMPVLDGLTLLREIHGELALEELRVVICSAVGDKAVVSRALEMGAEAYIVKPFTPGSVRQKLLTIYGDAGAPTAARPAPEPEAR